MSRNEKQLKEIIKTLGGTYSENDNCTCELLGRVNDGLKNILGSGLKLVESVDVSEPEGKYDWSVTYLLSNKLEENKLYLVDYLFDGYGINCNSILKLVKDTAGDLLSENTCLISYDGGTSMIGKIRLTETSIRFNTINDYTPIDELLYINIYELCLVSGESETPVKTITFEGYYDVDTIDLSKNGKYFLYGFDVIEGSKTANLGRCKNNNDIGKYIVQTGNSNAIDGYTSGGYNEDSFVAFINDANITYMLIEVTDDVVYIYGDYLI